MKMELTDRQRQVLHSERGRVIRQRNHALAMISKYQGQIDVLKEDLDRHEARLEEIDRTLDPSL